MAIIATKSINTGSPLDHIHDDRYYTETELDAGQLDNRYYTETEVDTISGSLNTKLETHKSSDDHDSRYYTESEVDDLITTISGKLDDHNELNNLDYDSAGHTGFASTAQLTTTSGDIVDQIPTDYISDSEMTTISGDIIDQIITDHGNLDGLDADDHTQYLRTDGARQLTGTWDYGSQTISGAGDIYTGEMVVRGATISGLSNVLVGQDSGGLPVFNVDTEGRSHFRSIETRDTLTEVGTSPGLFSRVIVDIPYQESNVYTALQSIGAEIESTNNTDYSNYGFGACVVDVSLYGTGVLNGGKGLSVSVCAKGTGRVNTLVGETISLSVLGVLEARDVGEVYGIIIEPSHANLMGTTSVSSMYGIRVAGSLVSTLPVSWQHDNIYQIYIGKNGALDKGTSTNSYGLYIEDLNYGVTNDYAIYQAGSDDLNYLAGNVGIGIDPEYPLHIIGTIVGGYEGNTISGTAINAAILSDGESGEFAGKHNYIEIGDSQKNSVIVGGTGNVIADAGIFMSMPLGNNNFIGGGVYNIIQPRGVGDINEWGPNYSVIVGGQSNIVKGGEDFIGGGYGNITNSDQQGRDVICGGTSNETIGGGNAAICGGQSNKARHYAFVGGGVNNDATGTASMIPGGYDNIASGHNAFAAGQRAEATHDGSFVWADYHNVSFPSELDHEFAVRAAGGARFVLDNDFKIIGGNLVVSGTVSADDPTADIHLTTKSYVDTEITTISGDLQTDIDANTSAMLRKDGSVALTGTWNYGSQTISGTGDILIENSNIGLTSSGSNWNNIYANADDDLRIDPVGKVGINITNNNNVRETLFTVENQDSNMGTTSHYTGAIGATTKSAESEYISTGVFCVEAQSVNRESVGISVYATNSFMGGSTNDLIGVRSSIFDIAGTANTSICFKAEPQMVADTYGFYVKSPISVTNMYGVYIEDLGATNYSIYSAGGKNYLAGNVGIGTTSPANPLAVNRQADDGVVIDIEQADAVEGTISVSSGTVSYNAFVGSHYTQLKDGQEELPVGAVVVSTGEIIPCEVSIEEVVENKLEVNIKDAYEEVAIELHGEKIGEEFNKYELVDEKVIEIMRPIYETIVSGTRKRLKNGIAFDEITGKLYKIETTKTMVSRNTSNKEYFTYVDTTTKAADASVYGVMLGKMSDDSKGISFGQNNKPIYLIAQVGLFKILVTDSQGDVSNGDFLETSPYATLAQKQVGVNKLNSTIAKAMVSVNWAEEKINPVYGRRVKLIPCVF